MSKLSSQAWTKPKAGLIFLSRDQQVAPDLLNPAQTLLHLLFAEALRWALGTLSWDVSGAARSVQHSVLSRACLLCWSHPFWANLPSPEKRALDAPIGLNGLDQPHLEPPHTSHLLGPMWGPGAPYKLKPGPCFGSAVGVPLPMALWVGFGRALGMC